MKSEDTDTQINNNAAKEANFDGLVGPTHNYAGLALGNLASIQNKDIISNPRKAALEGLTKMRFVMSLGVPQAIIPPHERPNLNLLRRLGFKGSDHSILEEAYHQERRLFRGAFSSSSMWAANAATVSASSDTMDNRLHITPANLITHFHRAQEPEMAYHFFNKVFSDKSKFAVHLPLPSTPEVSDEGAANHCRFVTEYGEQGVELFVYGKEGLVQHNIQTHFPFRQTKEASIAIARLHQLQTNKTIFVKQNPLIIEQGIFHNDVISLSNQNVFLFHEEAFVDVGNVIEELKEKFQNALYLIPISSKEFTVTDAVQTYLFNSQLITKSNGSMMLLVPEECHASERASYVLTRIVGEDNPIKSYTYVDCSESMKNGGGPACLRLRIVLTKEEQEAALSSVFLTEKLYERLVRWINKYYRDRLSEKDLLDPLLLDESRNALSELTDILKLGNLYAFQQDL